MMQPFNARPAAVLSLFLLALTLVADPGLARSLPEALEERAVQASANFTSEEEAGDLALVQRFYAERGWRPIWVEEAKALPRAFALGDILKSADIEGLDPADYDSPAVQALLASARPDLLADLELRLSLALVRYGADLNGGRLEPRQVDPELFVYPRSLDKLYLLQRVANGADVKALLEGVAPHSEGYRALKGALARYRSLAAAGGWPTVDPGETLDPGMRDARVQQLRARLCVTGDLSNCDRPANDPLLYDSELQDAVERFQARHGLEVDGRVGTNSLAHLNTPVEARIQQILANLERERWIGGERGGRWLSVNLADFTLRLYEQGREVLRFKVVIGTPYHRTPVFRRDMTYLEINPYWNVPPSIARNELLPKIRKNPGYLADHNYELLSSWSESASLLDPLSVDWSKVKASAFPYKIRQKPGEGNALGRVKFMLPNEFNIYLHDTPAKQLFSRAQRSFSHGCIRVEKPIDLAVELLKDQPDWTREAILAAVETGKRQVVGLARPLPVQIDYQTAWVDREGTLQFRGDVYGRDALLIGALLGPRSGAEALPVR